MSVTLSFWDTVTDAIAVTPSVSVPSISCELKLVEGASETSVETQTLSTASKFLVFSVKVKPKTCFQS